MADHALVIGCDAYPRQPDGDLRGAVADALAVREWLLSRDGGTVDRDRLTFFASCSSGGAQPGPGVVDGPADREHFVSALSNLVAIADAGECDRLYIYLAGHGCRTDPGNPALAQDVFVCTEFSPTDPPTACVSIQELETLLRQSGFGIIVVVVDACRDFPFRRPIRPGGLGQDPEPPDERDYEPRLFLLQSTLPGQTAMGQPTTSAAGPVRGVFTAALLDGLRGAGTAKTYDETRDRPYTVRWSSLVSYLETTVAHQRPRPSRSEGDIELASFPDGYFDQVRLTVEVDPSQFSGADGLQIRVTYADPSAEDNPELAKPGPAPVDFAVPPRLQDIKAVVGDAWGRRFAHVYDDTRVLVPVFKGGPPRVMLKSEAHVFRDGTQVVAGAVDLQSDDPAAIVQVRDASGAAILSGLGSAGGLIAPGMYTAVLIGSDGQPRTEPFEVDALVETRLNLSAPGPVSPLLSSRRAQLDLPWEMWQASDAAVLAFITRRGQLPDFSPPALIIAGTGGLPMTAVVVETRAGVGYQTLYRVTRDNHPWWTFVLPQTRVPNQASWLTVQLSDHTLTVPGLPGACTAVALGADRLEVAVFDREVLNSDLGLALLDRSQSLLDAGEQDAAALTAIALRRPRLNTGPAAAVVWNAAARIQVGHGLAASVKPADAVGLLPVGPWAAFVDHPADQRLPIGDVPDQVSAINDSFLRSRLPVFPVWPGLVEEWEYPPDLPHPGM